MFQCIKSQKKVVLIGELHEFSGLTISELMRYFKAKEEQLNLRGKKVRLNNSISFSSAGTIKQF